MLLEIKNLTKKYQNIHAVDNVSFSIVPGACFGLLGPNGAGKTTTIEMIEGVIQPTSGEILYKGKPRTLEFKEEVGIQFQHTELLSFLTVRETLKTFQSLYQISYQIEELIDMCHLKDIQNNSNDKISGGQKQRLMLALALVNKPELIFLDEPSTGLDPQARWDLWSVVEQIKSLGKTIILTTHYMEEAEHLCDEIAIMDHGRIIAKGAPKDLIKTHCTNMTVIVPKKNFKLPLKQLSMDYREIQNRIEIKTDDINACMKNLLSLHVDLTEITVRSPNL